MPTSEARDHRPPRAEEADLAQLREVLAETVLACLRDGNPLYYEDASDECADALIPAVTTWHEEQADRRARERAAEELRKAALEVATWPGHNHVSLLLNQAFLLDDDERRHRNALAAVDRVGQE